MEKGKRVRKKNVFVDHIKPVVDPIKGWTNWDDYIEGMFCEQDNLQLLCKDCHDYKTAQERKLRTESRKKND
jgi:5-methylcytosine-specific restriction endonuclease McrA